MSAENFSDFELAPELSKALEKLNFKQPTKVQKTTLPFGLEKKDLVVCAETGSGKTGAYGIPMVENIMRNPGERALVLAPTRELAKQISDFLKSLCAFNPNIKSALLVGGDDIRKQLRALKRNPQLVVATPGRITDHLKRGSISLKNTTSLVLDEGDRMLDMGFAPQLNEVVRFLPKKRHTSLFTATLDNKVEKLAQKYLFQPKVLKVGKPSLPVAKIKQSILKVKSAEKKRQDP